MFLNKPFSQNHTALRKCFLKSKNIFRVILSRSCKKAVFKQKALLKKEKLAATVSHPVNLIRKNFKFVFLFKMQVPSGFLCVIINNSRSEEFVPTKKKCIGYENKINNRK